MERMMPANSNILVLLAMFAKLVRLVRNPRADSLETGLLEEVIMPLRLEISKPVM
jgi:hypothetical protein